jgi:uncharacterized protein (DUF427 family)
VRQVSASFQRLALLGLASVNYSRRRADAILPRGGAAMVKANWNKATIADSASTVVVEGNHYFPPESVDFDLLKPSDTTTVCPWKGIAHYFHVVVNGDENPNAAWYYPEPKPAAAEIRDRVAFWKGVEVG